MPNVLLRLESGHHCKLAVLDTPAFPARYYAGMVRFFSSTGQWMTSNNDTCNFHRERAKAEAALDAMMVREKARIQEDLDRYGPRV